jgi:hypothetical protein
MRKMAAKRTKKHGKKGKMPAGLARYLANKKAAASGGTSGSPSN